MLCATRTHRFQVDQDFCQSYPIRWRHEVWQHAQFITHAAYRRVYTGVPTGRAIMLMRRRQSLSTNLRCS